MPEYQLILTPLKSEDPLQAQGMVGPFCSRVEAERAATAAAGTGKFLTVEIVAG